MSNDAVIKAFVMLLKMYKIKVLQFITRLCNKIFNINKCEIGSLVGNGANLTHMALYEHFVGTHPKIFSYFHL